MKERAIAQETIIEKRGENKTFTYHDSPVSGLDLKNRGFLVINRQLY